MVSFGLQMARLNKVSSFHKLPFPKSLISAFATNLSSISLENSIKIFNELKINGQTDAKGYALNSNIITNNVQAYPNLYPIIIGLINQGITGMVSQVAASNTEHNLYSDLNDTTLSFFK